MENLKMGLLSSSSPKLVLGYPSSFRVPFTFRNSRIAPRCSPRFSVSALSRSHEKVVIRKSGGDRFASVSSSSNQQTSSVGATPNLVPPPPSSSQIGSPLFWIAVGVGFSALFSWVSRRVGQQVPSSVQNYAMEQAIKTAMSQMNAQNNQFSKAAFSPPFPYATPPTSRPATSPSPAASQPAVTVDVPATKVEAAPATDVKDETETKNEPKKYAFVDVSPEETIQKSPFEGFEDVTEESSSKDVQFPQEVSQNGAASNQGYGAFEGSQSTRKAGSVLSVEDLEKMLEDPTVQQMVYPYLPEEIRNPETFKWMMQNPQYRRQLEDMLNNMSGRDELNSNMVESLKNFDLNSPEVKQQFDQIGLTPQEVMTKIMATPEIASAFQSPRVQAAIMDCSTNPQNLYKYQNDKEVMDVINKLAELFPGVTGPP